MASPNHSLRSFFSSVRLTIILLILIALVSIAGTLIPQQENAHEFLSRLTPQIAELLVWLQVFDIFHSYLFRILMGLLSLNILVCSYNRIALTRRLINAPAFPAPRELLEKVEPEHSVLTDILPSKAKPVLEAYLKKRFGKIRTEEKSGTMYLFAERHRFSSIGVYVVHLSILVIIAGALVGSFFGFEGYLNLDEGQSEQAILLRGGQGTKPLGFAVRCDHFLVEFYENGAPKTYRSDLSFIQDGRIVKQGAILVNHPISFENIRFYQASYGLSSKSRALLSYTRNGVKEKDIAVSPGMVFELAQSKDTAMVLRVEEDMMGMGPAVKLSIASPRGNVQFWVFEKLEEIKKMNPLLLEQMPLFNPGLFKPYVFNLNGMEEKYRTGIQVVSDPGLPIVITGGFLLLAGLVIVFWLSHLRFWIILDQTQGKTRIRIVGKSNGKQWATDREIDVLISNIRKEIKQV
jgi:cytochrome c biogenesis protein